MLFRKFLPFSALFAFILFSNTKVFSQNELPILAEPEIEISLQNEGPWSYDFGVSYRNLVYSDEFVFEGIQIELAHTTNYKIDANNKVGVGVKYRFREIFDESGQNELRFLQQYGHSNNYGSVKIKHRLRFEQRFRENTTFRTRYRLSADIPLGPKEKSLVFVPAAEILWSVASTSKPAFENRAGFSLEKKITDHTSIDFGLDYRHEDYTYDPEGAIYITGGISVEL